MRTLEQAEAECSLLISREKLLGEHIDSFKKQFYESGNSEN